jgi:hypothetical protein
MKIKKKLISYSQFSKILIILISLILSTSIIFNKIIFKEYFLKNFDKNNYYSALYGTGDIGCKTLKIIDPKIIFIGDSSAHNNWDLEIISDKTNVKIGSCFLPGFSIHSLDILIDFFKKNKLKPEIIILSYSYRTFAKNEGEGFKKQHQKMLADINNNEIQYSIKLFLKKLRGKNFFDINFKDIKKIENFIENEKNKNAINQLVNKIIGENLETTGFKNYATLTSKLNSIELTEDTKLLNNFCEYTNNRNTKIVLVKIPMSAPLEKNLKINFNEKIKIKDFLRNCIKERFYEKNTNSFDNKNEYFIINQYNENKFLNFQNYLISNDSDKYDANFFDFTHMNKYGAKKFSNIWINENLNFFKNESK